MTRSNQAPCRTARRAIAWVVGLLVVAGAPALAGAQTSLSGQTNLGVAGGSAPPGASWDGTASEYWYPGTVFVDFGALTNNLIGNLRVGGGTRALGATCSSGASCLSGFCADGVCCNTACNASGEVCNASGNVGTCTLTGGGAGPCSGLAAGTLCRLAQGPCDVDDRCDGVSSECPNNFLPAGLTCAVEGTVCSGNDAYCGARTWADLEGTDVCE